MPKIRLSVGTEVGWFEEEIDATDAEIDTCMGLPKGVDRLDYWRKVTGRKDLMQNINGNALIWHYKSE